ncbi:pro-neuregulin-3, membrane-bound isoform [Hippocampus zosterae]|uniref:pro-neuregulin-3, membrane-bound isoform n=1 Tax=Hippocampus zosterae TaxID=109293 RepID=UPI00223D8E0B|nr:pro-neuregulin-3, membrane-bound isoform [Hippocampus zosterae]
MSRHSGAGPLAAMTLEEPGAERASPRAPGPFRCGPCAVWPRQQSWLCAVPLVMGMVGLGLSLMLLKWIVVGSVQDYVPTDLVDPKGSMGQDPIFLSKPSAAPKGPDLPTAASTVSTSTPLAADGTAPAPRTRSGSPANRSADGNRAPHLHNRLGTRVGGTASATRAPRLTGGEEATPRGAVGKGGGAGHSEPGQRPSATAASAATVRISTRVQTSTAQPTAPPAKPTTRRTHGRHGKAPATRPHHRFRTPMAPTQPGLRSEVFKPCVEDKDLAFCLNEGECSIIETVAGVHRQCRCKEGYHGLRCDQFVPKTDAVLSDPTDELGIEFMESGDTYHRQVLSILSIASGMCLLGAACTALYRRNKRRRQKLRAHLSESRSLRNCGINASALMSKSARRTQSGLQKASTPLTFRGSLSRQTATCDPRLPTQPQIVAQTTDELRRDNKGGSPRGTGEAAAPTPSPRALGGARSKGKRLRSNSLSPSPAQRWQEARHFRTPPVSRGKSKPPSNPADASRHAYKHLREEEPTDAEAFGGCDASEGKVAAPLSDLAPRKGWREVPRAGPDEGSGLPPPSLRARSVPIIPSLQARHLEGRRGDTTEQKPGGCRVPAGGPSSPPIAARPQTPSSSAAIGNELHRALQRKSPSSPPTESSGSGVTRGAATEVGSGQRSCRTAAERPGTAMPALKTPYSAIRSPNGPSAVCGGNGNSS